jgi:hypothetical protein
MDLNLQIAKDHQVVPGGEGVARALTSAQIFVVEDLWEEEEGLRYLLELDREF